MPEYAPNGQKVAPQSPHDSGIVKVGSFIPPLKLFQRVVDIN